MLSACPSACSDGAPSTSGRYGQAMTQHALQFSSHLPRTAAFRAQIRHSERRANRGQLQTLCAIKKKSEKNLVCSKTLTIKPEHKDQVVNMCKQASISPLRPSLASLCCQGSTGYFESLISLSVHLLHSSYYSTCYSRKPMLMWLYRSLRSPKRR